MAVNTRTAPRRQLKFATVEELERDLEAIDAAQRAGTLRHTGNWTPGQILMHLASFWRHSLDGFPPEFNPPGWIKLPAKLLLKKKAARGDMMPPGIRMPKKADGWLIPTSPVAYDEGMSLLRAEIDRVKRGEKFAKPSPLFGRFTHEEWLRVQLGHCSLHLGFLDPGT